MENSVQLRPAFAWTCENCGKDNYVEGIRPDVEEVMPDEPAGLAEMSEALGVKSEWVMIPLNVKCKECKHTYETIPPFLEEEEKEG
jgi:hypothetical protein